MHVQHLVIPPKGQFELETDVIVTNAGDVITVHEFDTSGFEAHTCVPRVVGSLDLWKIWETAERSYPVSR